MKITEDVYIVGGGIYGIGTSSDLDCNVFAIDGGSEIMIVDAGVGVSTDILLKNIEEEGLDLSRRSQGLVSVVL